MAAPSSATLALRAPSASSPPRAVPVTTRVAEDTEARASRAERTTKVRILIASDGHSKETALLLYFVIVT